MGEISVTSIGTNRYAPEGCESVNLFNYNGCEGMTLAQLVSAVCVRSAAYMERSSVVQMSLLTQGANEIETLTYYGEWVLDCAQYEAGTTDRQNADAAWLAKWGSKHGNKTPTYSEIEAYLKDLGTSDVVANNLTDYHTRMAFYDQIQTQLLACNSYVDRIAIELETCITRRDSVFEIATTVVTHFGKSALNTASAYARG